MPATLHDETEQIGRDRRALRYLFGSAVTAAVLLLAEPMVAPSVPLAGGQAMAQFILRIPNLNYRGYRGGSRSSRHRSRDRADKNSNKEKDRTDSSSSSESKSSRDVSATTPSSPAPDRKPAFREPRGPDFSPSQ